MRLRPTLLAAAITLLGCASAEPSATPPGPRPETQLEAAPPDSDAPPVQVLVADFGPLEAGTRLLDVARVPGGVLLLAPDGTLSHVRADSSRRTLDAEVSAPLSVRGARVAYARGSMGEQEIATWSEGGSAVAVARGFAPAWNPALGPDRSVVFVSGRDGAPGLYRARPGAEPERLADDGRFPSSLEAPRFDGETLRFEDESGAGQTLRVRAAQVELR